MNDRPNLWLWRPVTEVPQYFGPKADMLWGYEQIDVDEGSNSRITIVNRNGWTLKQDRDSLYCGTSLGQFQCRLPDPAAFVVQAEDDLTRLAKILLDPGFNLRRHGERPPLDGARREATERMNAQELAQRLCIDTTEAANGSSSRHILTGRDAPTGDLAPVITMSRRRLIRHEVSIFDKDQPV